MYVLSVVVDGLITRFVSKMIASCPHLYNSLTAQVAPGE